MLITHLHVSSLRSTDSLRPNDLGLPILSRPAFDLEEMPDEIDLLALLWGHIQSYHLQFRPVSLPEH